MTPVQFQLQHNDWLAFQSNPIKNRIEEYNFWLGLDFVRYICSHRIDSWIISLVRFVGFRNFARSAWNFVVENLSKSEQGSNSGGSCVKDKTHFLCRNQASQIKYQIFLINIRSFSKIILLHFCKIVVQLYNGIY